MASVEYVRSFELLTNSPPEEVRKMLLEMGFLQHDRPALGSELWTREFTPELTKMILLATDVSTRAYERAFGSSPEFVRDVRTRLSIDYDMLAEAGYIDRQLIADGMIDEQTLQDLEKVHQRLVELNYRSHLYETLTRVERSDAEIWERILSTRYTTILPKIE